MMQGIEIPLIEDKDQRAITNPTSISMLKTSLFDVLTWESLYLEIWSLYWDWSQFIYPT